MKDYSVSDYGIFTDAVNTVNTLNQSIETHTTTINECKTNLNNGSVFMGPICDSCVAGFDQVNGKLSSMSTNFSEIAKYIISTSDNYKTGDTNAQNTVLDSSSDGTLKATSLAHITTKNGNTIYYNQKGYYDKNGKWCKWESSWGKDIASSGCGPTSMAAVLANMFGDTSITPSTVANMLNYDDNIGGNYVKKVADQYHLDQSHDIGLDQTKMNNFLRNDGKMIVAVNNGGHYISVLGINDSTNPPTYIVCDPNDSNTATKTWTYNDIAQGHTMVFHIAPKGKTVNECLKDNNLVQV